MDRIELNNGAVVERYENGITIDNRIYRPEEARLLRDWLLTAFPRAAMFDSAAEALLHPLKYTEPSPANTPARRVGE